jgi:uncharacterized lipoprotein YbaY
VLSVLCLILLTSTTQTPAIRGTATYRELTTPPSNAILEVVLEDVTRADAPAVQVGRVRVAQLSKPPFPFELKYDPSKIQSNHRFVMRARILVGERVLYATDTAVPVLTGEGPGDVSLLLAPVSATPSAGGTATPPPSARGASPLAGTSWQLVKFQSMDDKTLIPDAKTKYTLQFGADGSVAARIDCNSGHGTWTSTGPSQLTLGPLALTRAMCPPGSLHDRIVRDWTRIRSYVIKDGHLFLSLMIDSGIYEFEPMKGAQ